ncbi:MAG: phage portal protein [Pseudomonadota bacterium]
MSFLSRLGSWFRSGQAEPAAAAEALRVSAADVASGDVKRGDGVWESFTGSGSYTGPPSESTALAVSAVYACVNLIAGAIASLPMHIYRRDENGDLARDINSPLWWILNEEFTGRWPASAGWSFGVGSRLLHGDAFKEILRSPNGNIRGLVPLLPSRVEPISTPDGARLVYRVQPDPTIQSPDQESLKVRILDQDDMLHVPGFGFNGLRSLSPLKNALRESGRLASNAQLFSSRFLQNAARPEIALTTKDNLTQEQFDRLQNEFIPQHTGPENAGRPMVLEGGLEVKTLSMPMEDMQLIETRRFQVEEIARIYGVPPFMIGHTDKTTSWGSGIGAMGAGFVRFTLRDHLNAYENEINRKFFKTSRLVAKFDTSELERADLKTLLESFRIALGRAGEQPIMTVREVRKRLDLSRTPDGELAPNPGAQPVNPASEPPDPDPPNPDPIDPPKEPAQ